MILRNRLSKSNRAQADYFELLVCKYICEEYKIKFLYNEDLKKLKSKVLELPNGKERLKLQERNLEKIKPEIKKILKFEEKTKGKVIEVLWVGRKLVIKTTSDIDAKHKSNKFTKFSVKSIFKSGLGTIKNIGMRRLKTFLNVDFQKEYKEMWDKLREHIKENYRKDLTLTKKIKQFVLENEKLKEWATKNGKEYQKKLNDLCFNNFNKLQIEKKVEFINFILDVNDPDLYVIIVNEKGVVVYQPKERKVGATQKIEAKDKTDAGYIIYIDGVPTYRIQTNATNGIGISPFCQRVFFVGKEQT